VTPKTVQQLPARAVEAIQIHWEEVRAEESPVALLEEIWVEFRG